ncbi:hypothetical protein J6590_050113 [Homalodisca vitripennis]|nr:hypothetical protein J6590_050113 [Homalodisca vitripennis]
MFRSIPFLSATACTDGVDGVRPSVLLRSSDTTSLCGHHVTDKTDNLSADNSIWTRPVASATPLSLT